MKDEKGTPMRMSRRTDREGVSYFGMLNCEM